MFVCVEVLWPSQHNGVMSSAVSLPNHTFTGQVGWSGGAKVSCILRHRSVQLILAHNWARPAILESGKVRGGSFYFFCFFTVIPVPFFPYSSLSSLLLSLLSLFSLSLGDDTK